MTTEHIILLIVGIVLFVGFIAVLVLFLKRKKKDESIEKSPIFALALYEALGGSENITSFNIEHQRLGVVLNDVKKVNQADLKELEIPAFLKGNEIKLLIKVEPNALYEALVKMHKGE